RYAAELGIHAAFTADPGFFAHDSNRWTIPRFIFGRDWSSPAELREILAAAQGARDLPRKAAMTEEAPTHAGHSASDEGFRARFEMVPKCVAEWTGGVKGLDVLDFGCGEGISALGLALDHEPRRVVGIDIGPDPERCLPIARAQRGLAALPDNLEFHRVQPGFLHSADERFDVAYSWSVFEHVDQRLVGPTLELIRSSLKPGGLFLVQIAPLYYSPEGAHLFHRIPEPWVHLEIQHNALHEKLVAAVPDRKEFLTLWGTYRTLNRITVAELQDHLRKADFEILRQWTQKDPRTPPERLRAIYQEDVLTTHQVMMLARPTHVPTKESP
ncbi:MAG: methyltransferase domain-containing protein, partial [Gammaproteobacteria bacterium]